MASETAALAPEDLALLERAAERIVALRMEVPAILALEGGSPVSVLAGQTMIFFEPVIQALFRLPDYRRFASLVERREALRALTAMIERRAEAREAEQRAAKAGRRAARRTPRT